MLVNLQKSAILHKFGRFDKNPEGSVVKLQSPSKIPFYNFSFLENNSEGNEFLVPFIKCKVYRFKTSTLKKPWFSHTFKIILI